MNEGGEIRPGEEGFLSNADAQAEANIITEIAHDKKPKLTTSEIWEGVRRYDRPISRDEYQNALDYLEDLRKKAEDPGMVENATNLIVKLRFLVGEIALFLRGDLLMLSKIQEMNSNNSLIDIKMNWRDMKSLLIHTTQINWQRR